MRGEEAGEGVYNRGKESRIQIQREITKI